VLRKVAAFELRYQLTSPTFWITSLVFFALTFAAITSNELLLGWGGQVYRNSPYAVAILCLLMGIFSIFILTAFVANVVLRDEETGFGPIVYSTRLTKFDYLFGRFGGAFLASCLVFMTVPLAVMIGAQMPWLEPDSVGPFRPGDYVYVYFVLCLPTLFVMGAGFFALATATRSMIATYVGALILLALYYVAAAFFRRPEFSKIAAIVDPFGLSMFRQAARLWSPIERNEMLPALAGVVLANRVLWIAVGFAFLALAWAAFKRDRHSQKARKAPEAEQESLPARITAPAAPTDRSLGWGPLMALTRFDIVSTLRSPAYIVLLGLAFFNAIVGLWYAGDDPVSRFYPVSRVMIRMLIEQFTTLPIIIAAYYAGELVWRDRERRLHLIVDATPSPDWAFVVPKILAIVIVLLTMGLVSIGAAIGVQALKGYTNFEFTHYFTWYLAPWAVNMVLYAILAVFVQMLVPHKFVGLLIILLFIVAQTTFATMGLESNLYLYGGASAVPLSDMNGQGDYAAHAYWFRAYWAACAAILAVLAYALWPRGEAASLRTRLRKVPARLAGPAGWIVGVAAIAMASLGGWIYYNTNVLNEYRTFVDHENWSAGYEKTLMQFDRVLQPRIADIKLDIDLYPAEHRVVTRGHYIIENRTGVPLKEVHINWSRAYEVRLFLGPIVIGELQMRKLEVPGARITREFEDLHYRIYTFDEPLAPGERRQITFETVREQRGFRNTNNDTRVVANGTFIDNWQLTPGLGVSRWMLLQDRAKRRAHGLPPERPLPKLEDDRGRQFHYFRRDSDWVNADITISSVADQTIVAPGYLVDTKVANGRRTSRFKTEAPIHNFFSIQSADYTIRKDRWNDVDLAIYYHRPHTYNVERMIRSMKESLEYFSKNFSPYQFRQLRILEFPAYSNFAQAFPATVPYSEAAGFIINAEDPDRLDGITYITAHEIGHQWWGHQVVGADMQGQTVLSETLAQYSALMVMERIHGNAEIRRYLKRALDGYLRNRGSDVQGEVTLERVDDQAYIRYEKGGLVMYLLKDVIGEDAVNRALQSLLRDYAFKGPPYPRSTDLIDRLRAETPPEHQELITDLFQRITLYDLKVEQGRAKRRADGKWDVSIDIAARKLYADPKGKETEAPLDAVVDVGVFTAMPGNKGFTDDSVLILERKRVQTGKQTLTFVVDREPKFVGFDPYNKYVDRDSDDNVQPVENDATLTADNDSP